MQTTQFLDLGASFSLVLYHIVMPSDNIVMLLLSISNLQILACMCSCNALNVFPDLPRVERE